MGYPSTTHFDVKIHAVSEFTDDFIVTFSLRETNANLGCHYVFLQSVRSLYLARGLDFTSTFLDWRSWTAHVARTIDDFNGPASLVSHTDEDESPEDHYFFLKMFPSLRPETLRFGAHLSVGQSPVQAYGRVYRIDNPYQLS